MFRSNKKASLIALEKQNRLLRDLLIRLAPEGKIEGLSREIAAQIAPPALSLPTDGTLIISATSLQENMAGPAIRYWELARALSHVDRVTLAVRNLNPPSHADFAIRSYSKRSSEGDIIGDPETMRSLIAKHRVIVLQGHTLRNFPGLAWAVIAGGRYLAVDLYGPIALENLERNLGDLSETTSKEILFSVQVLNEQVRLADFLFCASEKQRDYWLGRLEALGRINPHTYSEDRTARRLIDIVPFGLPDPPPRHRHPVLKGVHPHVKPTDKVLIWAGGIWNWLDPLTLIQAMANITAQRQDVKLFFLSGQRSSPSGSLMEMHHQAVALSESLGLHNKTVFFHPWVPYDERENYFLEADVGLCFHFDHLETRFSFRTRHLDYIWAGLPMVVGAGDTMGDLIEREGLGFAVAPGDVKGMTNAILHLVQEPDARASRRENFERLRQRFTWGEVTRPLQRFCQSPWHAADKGVEYYSQLTSGSWESLLARVLHLEVEVAHLYNGRVMRLMIGSQKFLRRLLNRGEN
ncbi:MAG: glycosyltransferase [Chloroflexota bacterium]|nr:glycosyltransferase [Chloroflexota bacterium]